MIKKQVDSVDRSRSRAETFILVLALAMIAGIVVVVCAFGVNFIAGTANPVGDSSPASSSDALNPGRNAAVTLDSQATISVTGDVIGHMSMVKAAYDADTDSYDFNNIFTYIQKYTASSDYSIANLETTLRGTEDGGKYRGYPLFNTPDAIADALKNAKFDMLLTSNNHCYDTGGRGITRTVEVLDKAGLDHIGTVLTENDKRYIVKDVNGIKIGMMCYTFETGEKKGGSKSINGILMKPEDAALIDSFNYNRLDDFYGELSERITAMKNEGADATVLFIHWGEEYKTERSRIQKNMAQSICDLGIDVIVGGHPHVLQPVELLTAGDGSHKTVCLYSTGNAVSNQRKESAKIKTGHTEDGCLFSVTFNKYSDGRVIVADTHLLPTWVNLFTDADTGKKVYRIVPLDKSVEDWKSAFQLNDVSLKNAEESYRRTVSITGKGMTQVQAYCRGQAKAIVSGSDAQ